MSVTTIKTVGLSQSGSKWARLAISQYQPVIAYFGSGSNGAVTYSTSTNLTSTLDGAAVVMNYTTLTINAGVTVTTSNRCRGLVMYVQGDCTINGTLTMNGKGCAGSGQDIYLARQGSTASWAELPNELGRVLRIPATGGAGASGNAGAGSAGTGGGTGGGGGGAGGYAGSAGTSWGGGSGGGGGSTGGNGGSAGGANGGVGGTGMNSSDYMGFGGGGSGGGSVNVAYVTQGTWSAGYSIVANGGSGGGSGAYVQGSPSGGGGGGGAGGSGGPGGSYSGIGTSGTAGAAGSGGLLILIVGGTLTLGPSSVISSNGTNGGNGGNGNGNPSGTVVGNGGAGSVTTLQIRG